MAEGAKGIVVMEIKDFCSYELSMKLKEAGFNEETLAQWAAEPDGKPALMSSALMPSFRNSECRGRDVTAPLLYEAQKWLRECAGIKLLVGYCAYGYYWERSTTRHAPVTLSFKRDALSAVDKNGIWQSYEDALSDGIEKALELLK